MDKLPAHPGLVERLTGCVNQTQPARLETFVESGRIDALIVLTPTRTWPAGGTTPVVNWDGTDDAGALVDNVLRRVSGEAA